MNKKVIIIEGCDNCGKDTLISSLLSDFTNPLILHAGVPSAKESNLFNFYNNGLIHNTLEGYYDKDQDVIIHNRSMYGEFVYGPLYRSKLLGDVAEMIYKLEAGQLKTFIRSSELYLILLTSSSVELLVNNDDGLSISNKKEDIKREIDSFNTIFNLSEIENKRKIYVNHGDSFRNKQDIYNDVVNFIRNK